MKCLFKLKERNERTKILMQNRKKKQKTRKQKKKKIFSYGKKFRRELLVSDLKGGDRGR